MKTQKLYYNDAYLRSFSAKVLSCQPSEDRWQCVLDQTAFFPCEGGQTADGGLLGGRQVLDVQEQSGQILHFLDGPLSPGETVRGEIFWPERFRKMQNHSAEHILSGILHRLYGYENTGFHLAEDGFIFDCSGELSAEQTADAERRANEVIWQNASITAWFPTEEELKTIPYRSKSELTEDVRLVQIGDVDICACCAPHVARTGEIGLVKLTDAMRHRGGMRIRAKAGSDALAEFCCRHRDAEKISQLLSVPRDSTPAGVERLLAERDGLKGQIAALQDALLQQQIDALRPTEGNMLLFADSDMDGLRRLCNAGAELAAGVCAAFSGGDGDYRFVMASRHQSAADFLSAHREALKARGGGKPEMVSGSSAVSKAEIENVFA